MSRRLLTIGAIFLITVASLIIFRQITWLRPAADMFTTILRPLDGKIYPGSVGIQTYLNEAKTKAELQRQQSDSQQEIERLLTENSHLRQEMADLNLLREERDFLDQLGYDHVMSRVIGRSTDNFTHIIIINSGSQNGVSVGQAVIAKQGYLIGKVIKVQSSIAQVRLITDSQSQVAAAVQNDTNSPGLVVGRQGTAIEMELIPQNEVVATDQMVITSGLEEAIPRGLLIGKIISQAIPAGEIFQKATIQTSPLTEQASVVSVIINRPTPP
jgi:rod shape-determining protein MreC